MAPDPELEAHLEKLYAPPTDTFAYVIPPPPPGITLDDSGHAANRALLDTFHAAGVTRDLGNAILRDLNVPRPTPKSPETAAALKGWVDDMLTKVKGHEEVRAFPESLSSDLLISIFSPETAAALEPWIKFRARQTGRPPRSF
jgi:hypothetical protein